MPIPTTVSDWKDLVELVLLVCACVSPLVWIAIEKRVDARVERKLDPVRERVAQLESDAEDLEGRVHAVEWWRDQNAQDIKAIPRTLAILERLEGTLERLDTTLSDVGTRVARMEGPQ